MSQEIKVCVGGSIDDFVNVIGKLQGDLESIAARVSRETGIPDETELRMEDRDGNKPDSFNDVDGALNKIQDPSAVYYSFPFMNLVFVNGDGTRVGIRSTSLRDILGDDGSRVQKLIDGVKKIMESRHD